MYTGLTTLAALIAAGLAYIGVHLADKRRELEFSNFIASMSEGYYRSSLDGRQLMANPALVKLNGYQSESEMLAGVQDIAREWYVDPRRRKEFSRLLHANGQVENFVSEIWRHNTRERVWISENARLVSDSRGRPLYYEGTVREISDTMKRLELEERHRKFADNVPGVLFQVRWAKDGHFSVPYRSRGFESLVGQLDFDPEQNARALFRRIHPDCYENFITSARASSQTLTLWESEFRIVRPDSSEVWVAMSAIPQIDEDGSCLWHAFMMDITGKKRDQATIHQMAYFDSLTGLPNRSKFLEALKTDIECAHDTYSVGALLFVDLDNFKTLNDTRGHAAGDLLLKQVAARLRGCTGDAGTVGRFGGDEFVIALHPLENEKQACTNANKVAEAILCEIDKPAQLDDIEFQTTCSIGVALFDESCKSESEALQYADTALFEAKEKGRNRACFYTAQMRNELNAKVALIDDLKDAITGRQLELHYQVQVDGNGSPIGAEALLRWMHPKKGMVQPGTFIPLAEESGMILPITDWVLEEAFQTLERWGKDQRLQVLKLSINITAQKFHDPDFVSRVRNLADTYDANLSRLTLEMTEHALMSRPDQVHKIMSELNLLGIGLSLDDFGTGYSSLAHLRELPFDEVKIDGQFVKDLQNSNRDRAIVRTIVAMASSLNLKTVAEWVETQWHHDFLVHEGCDVFQGFRYGRAVELGEFEETIFDFEFQQDDVRSGPLHLAAV